MRNATVAATLIFVLFVFGFSPCHGQQPKGDEYAEMIFNQAIEPVDKTQQDEFGSHFIDLSVVKDTLLEFKGEGFPTLRKVLDNWRRYRGMAKTARKRRNDVTVDIIQNYYNLDQPTGWQTLVSQALTQAILAENLYRTVVVERYSGYNLTAKKAVRQIGERIHAPLITKKDSTEIAKLLLKTDGALQYHDTTPNHVRILGTEKRPIQKLEQQIRQQSKPECKCSKLLAAVKKLRVEIALAQAVIAGFVTDDPRPALVIDGKHGSYLKDIANIRGIKTRFFWAIDRNSRIAKLFSLK